ncbi:hypothetical protein BH18PSE1_BH18PSE1_07770 [soil metagenome]
MPCSHYPGLDDPLQIIDEYNITQVVASELDTSWTAKYSEQVCIHEFKLNRVQKEFSRLDRVEVSVVDLFGRLDLPALSSLDASDFVSLRLQEDAFEEWRSRLVSVLASMPEDSLYSERSGREFAQRARAMLKAPLNQIKERQVSKAVRQHVQDSAIGFTAGVSSLMFESALIPAISLRDSFLKLGASTASAFLASVLFRRPGKATKTLRKFYSLFEEEAVSS